MATAERGAIPWLPIGVVADLEALVVGLLLTGPVSLADRVIRVQRTGSEGTTWRT